MCARTLQGPVYLDLHVCKDSVGTLLNLNYLVAHASLLKVEIVGLRHALI
jgi:hypothetical protein